MYKCPDRVDRGISSGARCPDGKARRLRIPGVFEGGATQPTGMPRPGLMSRTTRSGYLLQGTVAVAVVVDVKAMPKLVTQGWRMPRVETKPGLAGQAQRGTSAGAREEARRNRAAASGARGANAGMTLTTAGLRDAVKGLLLELRLWCTHRRGVRQAKRLPSGGLKLHLGSGPNRKEGWINIDLHQAADLALDLRVPLRFAEGPAPSSIRSTCSNTSSIPNR